MPMAAVQSAAALLHCSAQTLLKVVWIVTVNCETYFPVRCCCDKKLHQTRAMLTDRDCDLYGIVSAPRAVCLTRSGQPSSTCCSFSAAAARFAKYTARCGADSGAASSASPYLACVSTKQRSNTHLYVIAEAEVAEPDKDVDAM